jgi:hypothetical protein
LSREFGVLRLLPEAHLPERAQVLVALDDGQEVVAREPS